MPYAYALLHRENDYYGISFPDYPGCISGGATAEEAIDSGGRVLSFHVAGMAEDGLDLPRLRTLEDMQADPAFREDAEGSTVALVPFDLPDRTVRVNITISERLVKDIDEAARRTGESRSAFLAAAARQRIGAA